MTYEGREIFTETPLALVAAEVSFSESPRLRKQEALDDFAIAVESALPIVERAEETTMSFGPTGPLPNERRSQNGIRMISAAKTEVLTLFPSRLTLETTRYVEFGPFRDRFLEFVATLTDFKVRTAITRIGLRYIDEIRVPNPVADARGWSPWVSSGLLDPLHIGPKDAQVGRNEGLMIFALPGGRGLNVRYAALPGGIVVSAPMPLRANVDAQQPFFVLDFDAYEEFDPAKAVMLDTHPVRTVLDAVHPYAGQAFQRAITDQSRALFRGEPQ